MGCSGSRPEADDGTAPPVLSPIRRRFDEIRQRRTGRTMIKDGTLSSKQLLQDEQEDGHQYGDVRKSVSSPPEKDNVGSGKVQYTLKMDAKTEVLRHGPSTHESNKNNGNYSLESNKLEASRVSHGVDKEREMEKVDGEREEEEHEAEREEHDNSGGGVDDQEGHLDVEGDAGFLHGDDSYIAPGSPSFRDYFISSAGNAADRDANDAGNGEDGSSFVKREQKPLERKESSLGSSEGSIVKSMKKEHKGKRFMNVLPKGKQAGVRNLLSGGCYNYSGSSVHGKVDAR